MKKSKMIKILTVLMCFFMFSSSVVAEEIAANNDDQLSLLLNDINNEYGTNFHILSDSELEYYGIPKTIPQKLSSSELNDLEQYLRYIAEIKMPEFEKETQEALSIMKNVEENVVNKDGLVKNSIMSNNTIVARRAINYATAIAEAYTIKDFYGNTIWGSVVHAACSSNMYQPIWFLVPSPTVQHIDSGRTLLWTGEGDYFSYVNGTQIYLGSGTQHTELYIKSYI